jgi:hypothetical protein
VEKKTIAICVPSTDHVWADFAFSMNACLLYTMFNGLQLSAIVNKKGFIVHQARCALVQDALNSGATHMMFMDSDHIFPKELIIKLASHDKEVVGVHCATKRAPIRSNCDGLDGKRLTAPGAGLQEVKRLGTGLMLVDLKVFKKMRQPYFDFKWDKERGWIGEDYYFCDRVREQGFKVYVDHDVSKECYHIGPMIFGVDQLKENKS